MVMRSRSGSRACAESAAGECAPMASPHRSRHLRLALLPVESKDRVSLQWILDSPNPFFVFLRERSVKLKDVFYPSLARALRKLGEASGIARGKQAQELQTFVARKSSRLRLVVVELRLALTLFIPIAIEYVVMRPAGVLFRTH